MWHLIICVFIGLERDAVLQSDGVHGGQRRCLPAVILFEAVKILNNNTFIAADFLLINNLHEAILDLVKYEKDKTNNKQGLY